MKKQIVAITPEMENLFSKINNNVVKFKKIKNFDLLFDKYKITESREELEEFLKSWDGIGDISKSYQQWMIDTGKSTTTFTNLTKGAKTAIKDIGAALASMAVMWTITKAIELTAKALDNLIVTADEARESSKALTKAMSDFRKEVRDGNKTLYSVVI